MGNDVSKIERLGLAEVVQGYMRDGVISGRAIAKLLQSEHQVEISAASVNRYLSPLREQLTSDAFKTIREHVDVVIPQDLKALEGMEAQCLAWAQEPIVDQIARIAAAAVDITGEVESWMRAFGQLDANDPVQTAGFVKQVIKQALAYVVRDARFQTKRIEAMAMATKIIGIKLANAGLMDGEGQGKIFIMDRSSEGATNLVNAQAAATGGRQLLDLNVKSGVQ